MTSYKPILWFAGLVVMVPFAEGATAQTTAQQVVDGLYPTNRLSPSDVSDRRSCFRVLSATAAGDPAVVVAAYTDGDNGVIRLIAGEPAAGYQVAYEVPGTYNLHGIECEIHLIDLNFDGRAELAVAFTSARGGEHVWLFRRSATTLTNITPTFERNGRQNSLLVAPTFTDVTHQGWMQIVTATGLVMLDDDQPTPYPRELFGFEEPSYRRTGYALTVAKFQAGRDSRLNVAHFRQSSDSQGPFVLRLVNGDRFGQHRVSSASVVLNGSVIINSVTNQMEFSEVIVSTLPIENTMTVSMSGDADATVTVVVTDSTVR